jgi:uncharacterized repeat protein (TIGR04138 family)
MKFKMLGQPDSIVPIPTPPGAPGHGRTAYGRPGFVSVWVATFPSLEEAEAYFGIPDEIGVYLPPEPFAAELGLNDLPPDILEVNFEQVAPRPIPELLADATFSASFLDRAAAAADGQGLREAQGVALLYDFDYRLVPDWRTKAGPLAFVGAFPFVPVSPRADLRPVRDLAAKLGCPVAAPLYVLASLAAFCKQRRQERGDGAGDVSAREFCDYLLACRGEDSAATLRELGLRRSEDVGRALFGLVDASLVRRRELDSEANFQGLFALE